MITEADVILTLAGLGLGESRDRFSRLPQESADKNAGEGNRQLLYPQEDLQDRSQPAIQSHRTKEKVAGPLGGPDPRRENREETSDELETRVDQKIK